MKERFDIIQNTDEWLIIKLGMFSASTGNDLLMDKKTAGYTNLVDKIVEECITGQPTESRVFKGNKNTDTGHEREPQARIDYELRNLKTVVQVGVVIHNDWVLCSPDGLIDKNGLIQIKCPNFKTQREYLRTKKVPTNYYKQMQFELFVTEREYNIFYSYHPYLPAVEIRVERDEVMIAEIVRRIDEAKAEVLNEIEFLKSLK